MSNIIKELQGKIQELRKQIIAIQDECPHPKSVVTKKHCASKGNYDPNEDCYWTDFTCGLCEKQWSKDGSL